MTNRAVTLPEFPDQPMPFSASDWDQETDFRGMVTEVTKLGTKYGSAPKLVVELAENMFLNVPCWRHGMRQIVEHYQIAVGDGIAIKYFGQDEVGRYQYGATVVKADA
jgi:hypothetical protein